MYSTTIYPMSQNHRTTNQTTYLTYVTIATQQKLTEFQINMNIYMYAYSSLLVIYMCLQGS